MKRFEEHFIRIEHKIDNLFNRKWQLLHLPPLCGHRPFSLLKKRKGVLMS
jgi:hypothetical protein